MRTNETTDLARNTLAATLVRADRLHLGDRVLLPTWNQGVELQTVVTLALEGDDVTVNNDTTTSIGNTFLVLPPLRTTF